MLAWRMLSLGSATHVHGGPWLRCLQSMTPCASVLTFGNGAQGALGLGDTSDSYSPEVVQDLPHTISGVAAGHYHSLAWDASEGHIFTWGRNAEKQLGRSTQDTGPHNVDVAPSRVHDLPVKVVGAAASGVASFAVDTLGCVWSWGTSKRGQLGQGTGITESERPQRLPGMEGIVTVACGWGHALALREDGQVFAWGYPAHGRLGNFFDTGSNQADEGTVSEACAWTPQPIAALDGVKAQQVSCSLDSSLVLTAADGGSHILTFGDNSLGQLGREDLHFEQDARDLHAWMIRGADSKPMCATHITAGLSHSMAVLCSGQVAVWGWQHGVEGLPETPVRPQLIPGLALPAEDEQSPSADADRRVHIAAGRVHSMIAAPSQTSFWDAAQGPSGGQWSLRDEGWQGDALLIWGNGQNGRLGLGSSESVGEPEVVANLEGFQILDMACGHDHSLVLAAKV